MSAENQYWQSLGASYHCVFDYDKSIHAYTEAFLLDDKDYRSLFWRAESYILSGERNAALKDIKKVIKICETDSQAEDFLARAKVYLTIYGKN